MSDRLRTTLLRDGTFVKVGRPLISCNVHCQSCSASATLDLLMQEPTNQPTIQLPEGGDARKRKSTSLGLNGHSSVDRIAGLNNRHRKQ